VNKRKNKRGYLGVLQLLPFHLSRVPAKLFSVLTPGLGNPCLWSIRPPLPIEICQKRCHWLYRVDTKCCASAVWSCSSEGKTAPPGSCHSTSDSGLSTRATVHRRKWRFVKTHRLPVFINLNQYSNLFEVSGCVRASALRCATPRACVCVRERVCVCVCRCSTKPLKMLHVPSRDKNPRHIILRWARRFKIQVT